MKNLISRAIYMSAFLLISLPNITSQTMTFNSCACESGFSFSGWGWYNAGGDGRAYVNTPNVNFTATITKNDLCFDLISFDKIPFGGGGGTWRVWDNTGRENFFTIGGGGTVTLNWTQIKWVKFKLEDPGTGGTNNAWDFDNLVYSVPTPILATVSSLNISQNPICPGGQVSLNFTGTLNDATEWKLYSGSCGGTLIGSTIGNSFTVNPAQTTSYYVRGEGMCTPPGSCASATVTVWANSTVPTSADANPAVACVGDPVSLSASGGTAGDGSSIVWYSGPGGSGTQLGTGTPINIVASSSTTYYARREGTCNVTSDINVSVQVNICDPCADLGGDTDMDGVCDNNDGCPNDPNKSAPGECGCGNPDTDSDADGVPDCNDNCPLDPNKSAPGECGCGTPDVDTDGDGTADCNDGCVNDPEKISPGICGCGVPDTDSDGDGTADCIDRCPNDPNKVDPGICGCGVLDTDSDGDGTPDCNDGCPNDAGKVSPGGCGCGVADTDSDGDGTPDCNDNCPLDQNKIEPGICGCGTPDVDTDGDGTADCNDGCPNDPNKVEAGICGCGVPDTDSDGDGTADCIDNCDLDPNKIEPGACGCGVADTDSDGDGLADCIDTDDDNDGQQDTDEIACGSDPLDAQSLSPDNDGDNAPDCVDPDDDNDGVLDSNDNCPLVSNASQEDLDIDGIGDACDPVVNIDGAVMNAAMEIVDLDLPMGLDTALIGKLDKALERYCSGQQGQALNMLNAFINQVSGQSGNQIPVESADFLIAQAQVIIDAILAGTIECPPDNPGMGALSLNQDAANIESPVFRLYPNPASNEAWLEFPELPQGTFKINLLDMKGKVMQMIEFDELYRSSVRISLKDYPSGLYFVQILQPEKMVETIKLVVEKK